MQDKSKKPAEMLADAMVGQMISEDFDKSDKKIEVSADIKEISNDVLILVKKHLIEKSGVKEEDIDLPHLIEVVVKICSSYCGYQMKYKNKDVLQSIHALLDEGYNEYMIAS